MRTHDELRTILRTCGFAGTDEQVMDLAQLEWRLCSPSFTGDEFAAILEAFDDEDALDRWADDGGAA
jgi:hypothetical protein